MKRKIEKERQRPSTSHRRDRQSGSEQERIERMKTNEKFCRKKNNYIKLVRSHVYVNL